MRSVVLVEGVSDQAALEALARRRGRDLAAEGITLRPIGGAHAIVRVLTAVEPDVRLAGLVDAGEVPIYARALECAGHGRALTREGLEELGFYTCDADLEDELIRALGPETVEEIIDAAAETRAWRTFRKQPFQRTRSVEHQLHRFIGTHSGRKEQYARLMVERLDLERVPRPLDGVLFSTR